ncbi:MAG TPA: FHA domain-containing protein [Candidatus Sulfopaludibacter sp.]|nr:FHA domain-containing protein [Candidatus Sulfopaludibacter sp.]
MIELRILAGKKAGSQSVVRRFPFRIGRASGNDLQLNDDGTWDQHLTLDFHRREGFKVAAAPNALVMINNQPVQVALLRNGDTITLGSAKLQFWLAAARQRGLWLRERFVWALLVIVLLGQFALIYWLLQ